MISTGVLFLNVCGVPGGTVCFSPAGNIYPLSVFVHFQNTREHFVALLGVWVSVNKRAVLGDGFDLESRFQQLAVRLLSRSCDFPPSREISPIENTILPALLSGRHAVAPTRNG